MLSPVTYWQESAGFPLLTLMTANPVAGMLMIRYVQSGFWRQRLGLAVTIVNVLLGLYLIERFDHATAGVQFAERMQFWGLSYSCGVDGLNILFIVLTVVTAALVMVYHLLLRQTQNTGLLTSILGYQAILIAAFSALNLLQFWLISVAELVLIFMLIKQSGWDEKKRFLVIRLVQYFGSSLLLVLAGFLLLAFGLIDSEHELTFDLLTLKNNHAYLHDEILVFILLFYGFAIRLPLFPFHGWLPLLAEQSALTGLTILIVGLKLGIYAMVRFIFPLVPGVAEQWAGFAVLLCLISIFYGALLAFMQNNAYRLLAFASISHTGILGLGVFSFNQAGLEGTLLLCLVYGLASAGMFFSISIISQSTHTAMIPRLGNQFDRHVALALLFLITALSTMIMPGSLGFDAGHVLLEGIIEEHEWWLAVTVLFGNVLAAAFLLWTFQRIFLKKTKKVNKAQAEPTNWQTIVIVLVICGLHIGTGLNSLPLLKLIDQEVSDLVSAYPMHSAQSSEDITAPDGNDGDARDDGSSKNPEDGDGE